jgi:glycosyltransferase involved in cell wall biosynthesis
MKIVYLIAGTFNSGGMERVLANKANYLVSHGYDIIIVTTDQHCKEPYFSLDKRIKFFDLNVNYADNNGKSLWNKLLHYPLKQRFHKRKLTKLLMRLKADIVISMFCNDVSFITNIKDGSKKILEIHFSKFKRLQYGRKGLWRLVDIWFNRQDEKIISRFDRFIVLTEEDKTYWGNLPNIAVIHNARTFDANEKVSELTSKNVVAIGRYDYQKGFDILLDIWREVCKVVPDWHLDIVGDGILHNEFQNIINKYGIEDRVTLAKPTDNIRQYYLNSSLLVMTSRYEGLPMVLLEAQAFGLPIVSFACKCGPRDIITDGVDGYLIEEGDKKLFTDKLVELINNKLLRLQMGTAAKINSERFAQEKVMKKWTDLFESLVAK